MADDDSRKAENQKAYLKYFDKFFKTKNHLPAPENLEANLSGHVLPNRIETKYEVSPSIPN
jgi:hypothetical protein